MEGIAAAQSRMSEIESLMASLAARTGAAQRTAGGVLGGSASLAATALVQGGTFDALVTQYASGSTALTAAAAELNSAGVPRALAGYGNGQIPESALAPVTGTHVRLWGPAATQLNRLIADAKADGVTIGVTDGYRDYDSQVRLAEQKGLYSEGGLAAKPGTSEHGWGMATDLDLDATAQAWMRQHATEYGFVEAVPREPWHWEFKPGQ